MSVGYKVLQAQFMPNSKIWKPEEIERGIRVVKGRVRAVIREVGYDSGGDIKKANEIVEEAIELFNSDNANEARKKASEAGDILNNYIYTLKRKKFPRWASVGYLNCIVTFYGFYAFLYSIGLMAAFVYIFWCYPELSIDLGTTSIPLWSLWVAGWGSTIQVLFRVISDFKYKGIIYRYERSWFLLVPFMSLGFGFAAYLIIGCGLWTFGGNTTEMMKEHPLFPMLICFLVGYSTDWFREKLSKLMEIL